MDSDGDGRHNGIELGDPWCQWTKENKYPLQLATSHPGKRNEYYFMIPKSYVSQKHRLGFVKHNINQLIQTV